MLWQCALHRCHVLTLRILSVIHTVFCLHSKYLLNPCHVSKSFKMFSLRFLHLWTQAAVVFFLARDVTYTPTSRGAYGKMTVSVCLSVCL